jgi:hypothetical protein
MSRPQIRVLQFERAGLIGFRRATFSASSAESCQQRSRLMQGLGHSSLAALDSERSATKLREADLNILSELGVTRDLRSCKTSTGRVDLQMMRSPSQWPASLRLSMIFGRSLSTLDP